MNKKILMTMVAASISAMSVAPGLIKEANASTEDTSKNNFIDLSSIKSLSQGLDPEIKSDLEEQVNIMFSKKTSIMHLSESISTLIEGYGVDNESIADKVYKELNFGMQADSSKPRPDFNNLSQPQQQATQSMNVCHSACHGACHSACHGSRGWR